MKRMYKRYEPKHLKAKQRIRLPMSAVLVYLLIAATLTTGVSFSRYSTTVSGSDSARVAKFEVTVTGVQAGQTFVLEDLDGRRSGNYTFTVNSNSEVSVSYDVVVSWTGTWLDDVTLSLDNGTAVVPTGTSYTFSNAGSFDPTVGSNNHVLTVAANDFFATVGLQGITVQVVASQID